MSILMWPHLLGHISLLSRNFSILHFLTFPTSLILFLSLWHPPITRPLPTFPSHFMPHTSHSWPCAVLLFLFPPLHSAMLPFFISYVLAFLIHFLSFLFFHFFCHLSIQCPWGSSPHPCSRCSMPPAGQAWAPWASPSSCWPTTSRWRSQRWTSITMRWTSSPTSAHGESTGNRAQTACVKATVQLKGCRNVDCVAENQQKLDDESPAVTLNLCGGSRNSFCQHVDCCSDLNMIFITAIYFIFRSWLTCFVSVK